MKYYGVETVKVVQALEGAFKLLETHSPGPATAEVIAAFKEKDPATGRSVMDDLRAAKDQASFSTTLSESGLQQFTHDVALALRCHAHLDTGDYGREVYKILTSTRDLAKCVLGSGPVSDPAVVRECDVWRGNAYASHLSSEPPVLVAWRMYARGGVDEKTKKRAGEILSAFRKGKGFGDVRKKLSALEKMELYYVSSYLSRLCGYDPEGRDVKGPSPMKHYKTSVEVQLEKKDMPFVLETHSPLLDVVDFAGRMASSTETHWISHGVEMHGDGLFKVDVSFIATDEAALKIAEKFPERTFTCLETGKAVQKNTRRPLGSSYPPGM